MYKMVDAKFQIMACLQNAMALLKNIIWKIFRYQAHFTEAINTK